MRDVVVVDNVPSTFAPLLAYFKSAVRNIAIVRGARTTIRTIFQNPQVCALLPNYFCLTDPDTAAFNRHFPAIFWRS